MQYAEPFSGLIPLAAIMWKGENANFPFLWTSQPFDLDFLHMSRSICSEKMQKIFNWKQKDEILGFILPYFTYKTTGSNYSFFQVTLYPHVVGHGDS